MVVVERTNPAYNGLPHVFPAAMRWTAFLADDLEIREPVLTLEATIEALANGFCRQARWGLAAGHEPIQRLRRGDEIMSSKKVSPTRHS